MVDINTAMAAAAAEKKPWHWRQGEEEKPLWCRHGNRVIRSGKARFQRKGRHGIYVVGNHIRSFDVADNAIRCNAGLASQLRHAVVYSLDGNFPSAVNSQGFTP